MAAEDIALLSRDEAEDDEDDEHSYASIDGSRDRQRPSRIRTLPASRSNDEQVSIQPSVCTTTKGKEANNTDDVEPPAQDYFFLSLFSLLCCLPLGLVALVFSVKASRLFEAEEEEQGRQTALMSLALNTVAIVFGILIIGVVLIVFVFT